MTLTLIIIGSFIVWFSSLWVAILSLMSIIGGWKGLSRIHPLTPDVLNEHAVKYSMSSIKLGLINYRSCVNVSFTETGIIFEIIKIFSVRHKPLFIPYNKIANVENGRNFFTYTKFIIDGKRIVLYGKAGDELLSRFPSAGSSI